MTTDDLIRVILLQEYGVRVTAMGVSLLGLAGGVVGTFLLLRRRALVGDALAHATYPGICLAFMAAFLLTGDGKSMPWLLAGAGIAGAVGAVAMLAIRRLTRLKEDVALGLVLGCFFGLGVVLMDAVRTGQYGEAAGLRTFLEGNPAALLRADAWLIGGILVAVLVFCGILFKELRLLCFDDQYAASHGRPVFVLDLLLMALVTLVVVSGLQAVGLILVIAVLIIPAAAARFWTHRLGVMCILAGAIGAASGLAGTWVSALVAGWPAGATIVLVASVMFGFSLLLGTERGLLLRMVRRRELERRVAQEHLLRSVYELAERRGERQPVPFDDLVHQRAWSPGELRRLMRRSGTRRLLEVSDEGVRLTEPGLAEARRVVRNHRLWEMYMISHADVAASHVDRGADLIEHILGDEMVAELERELQQQPSPPAG